MCSHAKTALTLTFTHFIAATVPRTISGSKCPNYCSLGSLAIAHRVADSTDVTPQCDSSQCEPYYHSPIFRTEFSPIYSI